MIRTAMRRRVRRFQRRMMLLGLGAGAFYFFNPRTGPENRQRAREALSDGLRRLGGGARRAGEQIEGATEDLATTVESSGTRFGLGTGVDVDVDDKTVADRVRSQVLGPLSGEVHVDVADGVVTLRGLVADPGEADALVDAATDVPGVVRVDSFLHRPGEVAPNKAAALRADGDLLT